MSPVLERYPELRGATSAEKLALAEELWASVRESGEVETPSSHSVELERRLQAVLADPSLALDSATARAQLKAR